MAQKKVRLIYSLVYDFYGIIINGGLITSAFIKQSGFVARSG